MQRFAFSNAAIRVGGVRHQAISFQTMNKIMTRKSKSTIREQIDVVPPPELRLGDI